MAKSKSTSTSYKIFFTYVEGIAMIAMNCNHYYPFNSLQSLLSPPKKVYALCLCVTYLNHSNSVSKGTILMIAMNISIQWVKIEQNLNMFKIPYTLKKNMKSLELEKIFIHA